MNAGDSEYREAMAVASHMLRYARRRDTAAPSPSSRVRARERSERPSSRQRLFRRAA